MKSSWAMVVLVAVGCASSPEARRAEEARRIRCASIEIFPLGVAPGRPYRVLGPLSVDAAMGSGDQGLRERACALDADAVVDFRRESAALTTGELLTGTAVAYTDRPSATTTPIAPAPAAEATAIGTPPPPANEATATGTAPQ